MIYLSPTTNIKMSNCFGVMFSANKKIGGLTECLNDEVPWMMDNNQFTNNFSPKAWLVALIKYQKYADTCLGIPIPDMVSDPLRTLQMFSQWWAPVSALGYPVAFVTQDGITPELVPWDRISTLFIGGGDAHKLLDEGGALIAEAKSRKKHVHVGRVNSAKRIKQFWMADSVDGTHLIYDSTSAGAMADAVKFCRIKKSGKIGSDNNMRMFT